MTDKEKIKRVQLLIGDTSATEEVVSVYLDLAKGAMLKRLYPFDTTHDTLPIRYDNDQCELAVRMYNRRGAEGEILHNENSINRKYGSVNDEDILSRLVPFAKLV